MKRTAEVLGTCRGVAYERVGRPVLVATLEVDTGRLSAELNMTNDPFYGLLELRGAEMFWLGKKCRVRIEIDVAP
jgi:hypothetical protein